MIPVMLVDDHQIIRDGIKQLLDDEIDIKVVAEATNVDDAIRQLMVVGPHVILTDLSMPEKSGFELVAHVADNYPDMKIGVLSMHIEEAYIKRGVDLGIKAYLPKDISKYELVEAIHKLNNGETYFSESVSKILMANLIKRANGEEKSTENAIEALTKREKEIVDLIMEGLSSPQIAEQLFISSRTVENHRAKIMAKLKIKNTIELVRMVLEHKYRYAQFY